MIKLLVAVISLAATNVCAGDFAYVTNQNDSSLSVIDLDERAVAFTIPIPGKPAGITVDTAKGHGYIVSAESKVIRKISLLDGDILGSLTLDGGPIGAAFYPKHNRLYVSDWYNARIWVIDAELMTVMTTLETGSAPAGLAVSGSGTLLVSADKDSNQVSIFDTETHELQHRVTVGERPFGVSFGPAGNIYTADVGSNTVTVVDPRTGKIIGTVATKERPYAVAFANNHGFVTNQYADSVSVFALDSLQVKTTIEVGEYPEGIDVSTDQRSVLVANWFSNTLTIIDAETFEVTDEIETGDGPRAFGRFVADLSEGN